MSGGERQQEAQRAGDAPGPAAPVLSVVVPMFEEAGNVEALMAETGPALAALGAFEVIAVDDGSADATAAELARARDRHPWLRVLRHERRCGKTAALLTGAQAARAPLVATMDGDGQNDPRDIARLLEAYRAAPGEARPGLVAGLRRHRPDGALKRLSSRLANAVRRRVLGDDCPDAACGLKLLPREVFLRLPAFEGAHRFLPALVQALGRRAVGVEVDHRPRRAGRSKYGVHDRLWAGLVDLLVVAWLVRRSRPPTPAREESSRG